ncbi:hypothetical protein MINT15_25280 [Saccharomonospora viridis]|uniref:Uncharacterized protein n=1 Tax=Saccharomonospora viridis TaxID=1852 RepID=A0A837D7N9_9PSEU|nr:hypothetical protein MINT15_25280 [Saccharomonospora viridis]
MGADHTVGTSGAIPSTDPGPADLGRYVVEPTGPVSDSH